MDVHYTNLIISLCMKIFRIKCWRKKLTAGLKVPGKDLTV